LQGNNNFDTLIQSGPLLRGKYGYRRLIEITSLISDFITAGKFVESKYNNRNSLKEEVKLLRSPAATIPREGERGGCKAGLL
jgi:hypothetical protein